MFFLYALKNGAIELLSQ